MSLQLTDFVAVPNKPGVYFFYGPKEEILYIGKAKSLKNRVKQYFAPGSLWKQEMLEKAVKLDFVVVTTESEALYLEDNLIKKHKPPYNSLLKADNSYVYLKITKGPFPLVMLTRKRTNDGNVYIGPKHNTRELSKLLQYLRHLFHYRTCSDSVFAQGKVCSDYHFGLCKGRCVYEKFMKTYMGKDVQLKDIQLENMPLANASFKPEYTYDEAVQKNQEMKHMLIDFFSGKTSSVENQIRSEIQKAVEKEHYEYAATLRDVYMGIAQFTEKQHVVLDSSITGKIMKVRTMESRFVLSVANIFEGKIIDVLRFKYRTSDMEVEDLLSDFRAEYGAYTILSQDTKTLVCATTSMKKVGKKILQEVDTLLDQFIDGYVASSTFQKENIMSDLLQGLQTRYDLPRFPYIIECTDISHLSGGWTSGAVVSMKEGLLNKKGYRKYKIGKLTDVKTKVKSDSSDDYASLKELIIRRFKGVDLEHSYIPDLFVLDGGKGQLDVVKQLYHEEERFHAVFDRIHFCSFGKGAARKRAGKTAGEKEVVYWFDATWKIQSKELQYDDVDRLLVQLRDEAHRFANAYRKKQMSMEIKKKA